MRNRWFHAPTLHTHHDPPKRVTWLELFYDLIFVASIIQLGDALSDYVAAGSTWTGLGIFALHFVPLWIAWTGVTFYANRFDVDDFLHRTLVLVHMAAVGCIGIFAPLAMAEHGDARPFAIAFAASQAVTALMYARAWANTPVARSYSLYWGSVFAAGAVTWLASTLLPSPWLYLAWAFGVGQILFAPLFRVSRDLANQFPLDMEHLAERYGLLTIIVLGESFVKMLSYLADGHGVEGESILKGLVNLLIMSAVWWVYFDDVAGGKLKEGRNTWILWLYAHLPLTMAVTAVGVAVKYDIKMDLYAPPAPAYRTLLIVTLATTFASVALIDKVTERNDNQLDDRWRVGVRLASAAMLPLVGFAGDTMSGAVFLGAVAAICVAQVLFDMAMAPLVDTGEAAVSTGTLARDRASGRLVDHPDRPESKGWTIAEPVRRGTPSDLRRDMYFWLMEGGWTRMFFVLGTAFVTVNVVFACLFLLDPASIRGRGVPTFLDAFSFSVQTIATIGYGAMSPGTPYSDTLVFLLSIVGIFYTALATGLMFAKASRPNARVLFSNRLVLTTWHGRPTLVLRAGNARGNEIVDATIHLSVLTDDVSPEGHHLRRVADLTLERHRQPLFMMSWVVRHVIDEDSPLHGVDFTRSDHGVLGLVATMQGHDTTYGQTTYARHVWTASDIHVGHRFTDIISELPDGRMMIDYTTFHDVVPDEVAMADVAEVDEDHEVDTARGA